MNVAIDSCSTACLMTDYAAEKLGLEGKLQPFVLKGVTDSENNLMSPRVEAEVASLDGSFSQLLKGIQVIPVITDDTKALDWRPILSTYGIEGVPPAREGQIDLLIGMNYPLFLRQHDFKKVKSDLTLIKNDLGWSGCGIADRREIMEGQAFKISYSSSFTSGEDDVDADRRILEEGDSSELLRNICLIAEGKKPAAIDIKRLVELVQNSTLYDNFPETGMTVEEERCLKIMRDTYRVEDGQAYISPLWREGQPSGFTNNYRHALNRLNSILRPMTDEHFDCINKIFEDYLKKGLVEEVTYEVKNPYEEHAIWWAHFPVMNPNSETTPVRPVMDGKAPCINGKSINDHCFHCGPCLINDLTQVLLRYRKHDVAFTGDISKMFLRIHVPEEYRKYSRFIWVQKDHWKEQSRRKLRYFQFKGHVFGKVCSPTCAIWVTQKNAEEHKATMPRAAEAVIKSTLVDDTLDSVPTATEAVQVITDLVAMSKHIGLDMAKFATTSMEVAQLLPPAITKSDNMVLFENFNHREIEYGGREYSPRTVPKAPTMRTLGQYHNMVEDTLGYVSYEPDKNLEWTKTKCLSQAMKIFDPLGYAVPIMLEPKLIMQELWRRGTEWTDTLTPQELNRWSTWLPNLPRMEELKFRRVLMPGLSENFESVQVHVFSGASALAFSSVAYIRITYKDGRPNYTNFIQAKNNIAPIKVKRTIPKLELMSIHQGARLADHVCKVLDLPKKAVTLWSDSKTALQWLRMESTTLLLLIHNYCEKITALFSVEQIRWVPGQENVANIATRPRTVEEVLDMPQWTKGPKLLSDSPGLWPEMAELQKTPEVMEGVKKDYKLFTGEVTLKVTTRAAARKMQKEKDLEFIMGINKFSSYGKILRVFAYIIRYFRILKARALERKQGSTPATVPPVKLGTRTVVEYKPPKGVKKGKKSGYRLEEVEVRIPTYFPKGKSKVWLTQRELEEAELRLVRQHQLKFFNKEIDAIRCGRDLLQSNKLCRLGAELVPQSSCFDDDFEVLRLGGRIAVAPHLCEKMRRPFVLHPDDELVKKMLQHYHTDVLKHMGGLKCLTGELNRSRWIVGSISQLKKVLRECYHCRMLRPRPTIQRMAPLPTSRIPGEGNRRLAAFTVTALDVAGPWLTSHGEGKSKTKRWLLIFRCAMYGAVHLEMLWSLDTGSFLMALSRFVGYTSKPKRIICDRGTNFIRGNKEIDLAWEKICTKEVANNEFNIEFVFSPAESPHFNGLIERMVGESKKNLEAILSSDEHQITDEVLETSFKVVQRLLNDRPIGAAETVDPRDPEPITPAHFLMNGNIHEDIVPPHDPLEGSDFLTERYWTIQHLLNEFWTRLCRSLTPKLREHNKWITKRREVQVGDVVCILEDALDSNDHYRVGIIQEVAPGLDDMVRKVTVRVKDGKTLERGLNRIYVLVPKEKLYPKPSSSEGRINPEIKGLTRESNGLKRKRKAKATTLLSRREVSETNGLPVESGNGYCTLFA